MTETTATTTTPPPEPAPPKTTEEHIDILRGAIRQLLSQHAPVTGDLEEKFDISWPVKEEARLKAAREAATARVAAAKEAEARAKDTDQKESPAEKAARVNRENAEAELAALQPTTPTPKHSSPNAGKAGEEPYKPSSRANAKVAIAAFLLGAGLLMMPQPSHAAGNFIGLPAAIGPGSPSIGAPATGGGPITPNGCIPMDTGFPSGINPATQCVSPNQLSNYAMGVQLSYSTAAVPGTVPLASLGNDTTPVSGSIYLAQITLPAFTVTNISCLNGSVASTNNLVYGLYNSSGLLVASTALAGVVAANANVFQTVIPLTSPYAAPAGLYYVAYQTNGTTTRFRTITANGAGDLTASYTGVFGTLPSLAPPTAFAANVGPICFVN